MNYLVTGGAGFLGINLVRDLLSQGHTVRSYDLAPFDYPEAPDVTIIQGDIRNKELHKQAFEGVDIVVHCAAALPLCTPEEIISTEVDGTRMLLESAVEYGVKRFIHISSTAVYGVPDHHPIYEHDKLIGVGPYGEAKIQAESVCQTFRDKGLCVSVLRPKSFVGPERLGVFELLYDFAYTGHNFPVLGSGNNLYQLMDVEDLCHAIDLCATREREKVNDTFNVGAARYGTLRESFQAVLDRAGYGKHVIGIPAGPAIMILRMLEAMHLSPLYKWVYDTAGKESFVGIDKITETLGFAPEYSNEEALIRNYDWYVANHATISKGVGTTHRKPWKKGALKLAKLVF